MATAALADDGPQLLPGRVALITITVMLGTFMQVLDSTIANVALPHMQASLGAAADTISWVLTSYIVATAVAIPLTGWLAARVGRRRLFIMAICGFVLSSMLCGMAQSLGQMVVLRLLQGASGAFLLPLGQAFLLDAYPKAKHGQAMAMWGVGVMVGPVMGPVLGGWLTDNFDWRWVFYINVPFGILTLLGALAVLDETPRERRRFDLTGFVALAIGLLAFQVMLDRGQQSDWFESWEVRIEAAIALTAFWIFGVHTATSRQPTLFDLDMVRDPNAAIGFIFTFLLGLMMVSTSALLPPMLEGLLGYPVLATGMVLAPRGLGTMAAMYLMGRLVGRVDARLLMLIGLAATALSMWMMSGFAPGMDSRPILISGLLQGLGMGFMFVPLNTLAFATLPGRLRTDAASFFSLVRNIGGSIGVSVVIGVLARQSQIAHADIGAALTPFSLPFADAGVARALGQTGDTVMTMLNGAVTAQAAMIGYIDVFRMLLWVTIAQVPFLLLLRAPPKVQGETPHMALD